MSAPPYDDPRISRTSSIIWNVIPTRSKCMDRARVCAGDASAITWLRHLLSSMQIQTDTKKSCLNNQYWHTHSVQDNNRTYTSPLSAHTHPPKKFTHKGRYLETPPFSPSLLIHKPNRSISRPGRVIKLFFFGIPSTNHTGSSNR